jgi:hypothetical protein
MAGVISRLTVALLLALLAGCTGSSSNPAPGNVPTATGRAAVITVANGAPLYTDEEIHALELKVVTEGDFQAYPLPAVKLAPKTHVEISTQLRTITLKTAAADYPIVFERIRVVDGPASGLQGWVQAGSAE